MAPGRATLRARLEPKLRDLQAAHQAGGASAAVRVAAAGLRASSEYRLLRLGVRLGLVSPQTWSRVTAGAAPGSAPPESERFPAQQYLPYRSPTIRSARPVVVVPVYRGVKETERCVRSVLESTNRTPLDLLLVDDASPEPDMSAMLDTLCGDARSTILSNETNLGFVASVDRGMEWAGKRDVILLNSDTMVAGDWIDRLVAHAYSSERVATVTPFSNNATICSYPSLEGWSHLPPGETVASIDAACAEANLGRSVDVPTGVGFCMYIRRASLDDVGGFDEATFGRGYGEENDFCLRAASRGWRNLLACDTFVWHEGEVSFGGEATPRQAAGLEKLCEAYPGYLRSVAAHVARDPARPYRVAATAARYRTGAKPVLLFVTHDLGGGTDGHLRELCERVDQTARVLVLSPQGGFIRLRTIDETEAVDLVFAWRRDELFLPRLLSSFGVSRVHIHHLLHLWFDVRDLIQRLDVPFDFTVHDYYTICPRVRLLTPRAGHCDGPEPEMCARCLRVSRDVPTTDIRRWWAGQGWQIMRAQRVICPSTDVAQRVLRTYPDARVIVVPHDDAYTAVGAPIEPRALTGAEPLRIAVLGVLTNDKGAAHAVDCAALARRASLPLEFWVIGPAPDVRAEVAARTALHVTGPYGRAELNEVLDRVAPHVVWFPTRWPETYSYTLSEAFRAGLPVAVPDFGAFPERVSGRAWSWILPWNADAERTVLAFIEMRNAHFATGVPPEPTVREVSYATRSAAAFYEHEYLQASRE